MLMHTGPETLDAGILAFRHTLTHNSPMHGHSLTLRWGDLASEFNDSISPFPSGSNSKRLCHTHVYKLYAHVIA
jgi:hypothetical protein